MLFVIKNIDEYVYHLLFYIQLRVRFTSGKECCHILLQTIPGHIDVEEFQARFLQEFPAIVNVHHLHIWTFTPENVCYFNLSDAGNILHC